MTEGHSPEYMLRHDILFKAGLLLFCYWCYEHSNLLEAKEISMQEEEDLIFQDINSHHPVPTPSKKLFAVWLLHYIVPHCVFFQRYMYLVLKDI